MEKIENFRKNLKEATAIRGMRTSLAKGAGISTVYFFDLLSGKKLPSLETAIKIATAMDMNVSDLLGPPTQFRKKLEEKLVASQ